MWLPDAGSLHTVVLFTPGKWAARWIWRLLMPRIGSWRRRVRGARAASPQRRSARARPARLQLGDEPARDRAQVVWDGGRQQPRVRALLEQVGERRRRAGEDVLAGPERDQRVEPVAALRGGARVVVEEHDEVLEHEVRPEAGLGREHDGLALRRARCDRRPADPEALAVEVDVVQPGPVDEAVALGVADLRALLPRVPEPADDLDVLGALRTQHLARRQAAAPGVRGLPVARRHAREPGRAAAADVVDRRDLGGDVERLGQRRRDDRRDADPARLGRDPRARARSRRGSRASRRSGRRARRDRSTAARASPRS